MGRITIDNLSESLKDYLKTVGIPEDRVIQLIKENTQDILSRLYDVEKDVSRLNDKVIDILIYLDIASGSEVDDVGYWYDPLNNGDNIVHIEGLILDPERKRIFGAPGNVIFKELSIPFKSDQIKITIDMDNNFIENISNISVSQGSSVLNIERYSYEVK